VEQLPFPDASFDGATCRYAAHHFADPRRALAEAARVLRPGARLLLHDVVAPETPAADTFLQAIELLRDHSHVRDHRVSEWEAMLREAGFTPRVLGRWPLATDFEAWVERMATPAQEVAMLRRMLARAPREARQALAVGRPGPFDFALPTALLEARRA
jgi:SAM-dependent methyltransferase